MSNSDTTDNSTREPLLRLPGARTPPRHAFQIRTQTEAEGDTITDAAAQPGAAETNNNDGDTQELIIQSTTAVKEREIQLQLLKALGRPYAGEASFWCHSIPAAILLGCMVGLSSVVFLLAVQKGLDLWLELSMDFSSTPTVGDWKWLGVTITGGFLSGVIFALVPGAPPFGAVRTFFHDTADLGSSESTLAVVLASTVALVSGAPMGPEQALGSLGSGLAATLAAWLPNIPRRTEALWILSGLSASLSGIFPFPLLGPMLVHELSVTGRPDRLTLDAVVTKELSDSEEASEIPAAALRSTHHDFFEVLSLQVLASTVSALFVRWIYPDIYLTGFTSIPDKSFEAWHLVAAVPIGLLCGMVGSSVWICITSFRYIKSLISRLLEQMGLPAWVASILLSTLAGTIHGLLAVACPYGVGSGLPILSSIWNAAIQGDEMLPNSQLIWTAVSKIVGLGACVGFGLVGGPVVPVIMIGLLVGIALANSISVLSFSLVVPCCLVACPVSICPTPFTAVVATTLILNCSAEQTGPLLISCVVAWTVTGGLGALRRLGEKRLGPLETASTVEESSAPLVSDDEILRGVRTAIFGSESLV